MTSPLNIPNEPSNNEAGDSLPDTLPAQGLTRLEPLALRLGINRQTLRRWYNADKFPKPKRINGILLFNNSEILNWLAQHEASN